MLGDIADPEAVVAATAGAEAVYNFAGLADLDTAREQPLETARANVLGNLNLLEAAREAGVGRFVFASTIYVFGDAGSFYRVSKQACELYVEEYSRAYGLDYTILRFGTLYGRRATDANSVHRYLQQALSERRITAQGTGDELREYIHVEDAARLCVEALGDEYANEQLVLTGNHPLRFRELLELIGEIAPGELEIELTPPSAEEAESSAHYAISPYSFKPRLARKLVSNHYTDIGQGLLDCMQELDEAKPAAE